MNHVRTPISRRELIRRGGVLGQPAGAAAAPMLGEAPLPNRRRPPRQRLNGLHSGRGRLQVDRRAPAHQRPRHVHDHQRFDDAAGGARGDGRGGAASTCTSTSWPKPSARGWRSLTGAEWGLVTNGCSAGLTLATAACVAGGNPDLHVRLPNLSGFRQRRSHHPDPFAQRLRRGDPRRSACASSKSRRRPSSRRRSGRAPRSSTSWRARASTRAR